MSFGERIAITQWRDFQQHGLSAEYLDAREVVRTDNHFGQAHVALDLTYRTIQRYFRKHSAVQVITGFIGATADGLTTTLGRGGSDYTAALFGAALRAKEVQIWTDVDGMMTANPRVVPGVFLVEAMSYHEAMGYPFGAKVIYSNHTTSDGTTFHSGLKIPNPKCPGTLIVSAKIGPCKLQVSAIDQIAFTREGTGLVVLASRTGM